MALGNNLIVEQELQLIERFTQIYRRKLGHLIDRLNGPTSRPSDVECIRLCVEAVDVVLASQASLANALERDKLKRSA